MSGSALGRAGRPRDDAGGMWIRTGVVLGVLVYLGVLVMAMAGFTAVVPLVVLPPILIGVIGAANLLDGRSRGRSGGGRAAGRARSSSSGPNGAVPSPAAPGGPGSRGPQGSHGPHPHGPHGPHEPEHPGRPR